MPEVVQGGLERIPAPLRAPGRAEIDIGLPRWADDPRYIFGVVANYLRLEDPSLAPDALFGPVARAEADAMIDTLEAARARRRGRLRGRVVRFALGRARAARRRARAAEVLPDPGGRGRAPWAAGALVGAELAGAAGASGGRGRRVLHRPEGGSRRARAGGDLRGLIAPRRAAYDLELRRRHVPRVMLSDGTEPEAERGRGGREDGALVGTPASAGTVTWPPRG